ncbi:hypothetical protein [Pelosinus sp. IPA-1]|nr:hypothetical protein [Pelosinus sp. IPA-1]GMB00399.1 hypothetical protein PIPA1_31980 [Pelosinus sp. IPA-1]
MEKVEIIKSVNVFLVNLTVLEKQLEILLSAVKEVNELAKLKGTGAE